MVPAVMVKQCVIVKKDPLHILYYLITICTFLVKGHITLFLNSNMKVLQVAKQSYRFTLITLT